MFYGLNNIELEAPDDDAYDLVIAIATAATPFEEAATHLAKRHQLPARHESEGLRRLAARPHEDLGWCSRNANRVRHGGWRR